MINTANTPRKWPFTILSLSLNTVLKKKLNSVKLGNSPLEISLINILSEINNCNLKSLIRLHHGTTHLKTTHTEVSNKLLMLTNIMYLIIIAYQEAPVISVLAPAVVEILIGILLKSK